MAREIAHFKVAKSRAPVPRLPFHEPRTRPSRVGVTTPSLLPFLSPSCLFAILITLNLSRFLLLQLLSQTLLSTNSLRTPLLFLLFNHDLSLNVLALFLRPLSQPPCSNPRLFQVEERDPIPMPPNVMIVPPITGTFYCFPPLSSSLYASHTQKTYK